jgi:pimeloyl-ACP methyl ester carboxylesterase
MVNWVQVYRKHVLALVAKSAGLREHAVDVDDAGTVINFWLPRHKQAQEGTQKQIKLPVVLVHGFAGDGIMTWWLQVGALSRSGYDVYVPDLIHFGGSTSPSPDRSVGFQARCLAAALQKLGVAACDVVGFSYGGPVVFEMAAAHPGLVRSVVVSGGRISFTDVAIDAMLGRFGARTLTGLMLPESVEGVRSLLSVAVFMKLWFPRRFLEDFLKVSTHVLFL